MVSLPGWLAALMALIVAGATAVEAAGPATKTPAASAGAAPSVANSPAREPAAPAPPSAAPQIKLEPAKPVALACDTKSVVVAEKAANATTGRLHLTVLLKDAGARPQTGVWRVAAVDEGHSGSLGRREAKTCTEACPLTVAADGNIELWSPSPKGIHDLAEGEHLLLAVVKSHSLDLRATTFNGKQVESLEEGTCRIEP